MAVPILVVTPNVGFGELICQILDETGDFALMLATNRKEALKTAKVDEPALMILETELNGTPVSELVEIVRKDLPDLLLILIVPELASDKSAFSEMNPNGVLQKPVYLPDLMTMVDETIRNSGLDNIDRAQSKPKATTGQLVLNTEETPTPPPAWLSDVNLAAQHLARLSLESSAQASLISKGDQIYAYAGELPRPAAEELARTVASHFENGGGSDLARFIRLDETGGEYMLYATGLGGEYVLATVFDAEMPFSKIRAQASHLAVALSSPPSPEVVAEQEPIEPELEDDQEDEEPIEIGPILEDVPPPIPENWQPETKLPRKTESLLDELLEDAQRDAFSTETLSIDRSRIASRLKDQYSEEASEEWSQQVDVDMQAASQPGEQPKPDQKPASTPEHEAETVASRSRQRKNDPDETRVSQSVRDAKPPDIDMDADELEVEPVSPSMYNLTYACVLIPRFPHHHLTGEIAKRLSDWITHLCVAFGWRLENLTVRPGYVQWLVNVPPNTSPGYLMRTIRQHTSRRMFIEFPVTENDNLSGDFWAPGYLILGNPQPPPPALVKEFIQNTRNRQGLEEQKPS
jgi:REP element-mobilizing transposase RayT/DNA-binding response OmpR family regulator